MSGWRLWDAPSLRRIYDGTNDFEPPAVHDLPHGFPASAGWVGRRMDFRFRAGGSGVAPSLIRFYCKNDDFGHPAVQGPPHGFPADLAGRSRKAARPAER